MDSMDSTSLAHLFGTGALGYEEAPTENATHETPLEPPYTPYPSVSSNVTDGPNTYATFRFIGVS